MPSFLTVSWLGPSEPACWPSARATAGSKPHLQCVWEPGKWQPSPWCLPGKHLIAKLGKSHQPSAPLPVRCYIQ